MTAFQKAILLAPLPINFVLLLLLLKITHASEALLWSTAAAAILAEVLFLKAVLVLK